MVELGPHCRAAYTQHKYVNQAKPQAQHSHMKCTRSIVPTPGLPVVGHQR